MDQGRHITQAVSIPVIGDGDNGYGNAMNVKRTVKGYISAGFAGIILEDQVQIILVVTFLYPFVVGKQIKSMPAALWINFFFVANFEILSQEDLELEAHLLQPYRSI